MSPTKGNNIILVGGCFDLLHYGHISFLSKAKSYGDYLIVALESDENVRKRKGITRPIHTQNERKAMLEALSVVDEVIPLPPMNTDKQYAQLVSRVHPSVIVITAGDPLTQTKKQQAQESGAAVIEIEKVSTPSTTQLVKLLGLD